MLYRFLMNIYSLYGLHGAIQGGGVSHIKYPRYNKEGIIFKIITKKST